jgi:hypothetical protein
VTAISATLPSAITFVLNPDTITRFIGPGVEPVECWERSRLLVEINFCAALAALPAATDKVRFVLS